MGEFDILVDYLKTFESSDFKDFFTKEADEVSLHPVYPDEIRFFMDDVTKFALYNSQYGLTKYKEIIENYKLNNQIEEIDVSNAEAIIILALLVDAVRSDRFCTGAVYGLLKNGTIRKWLERLKELNEKND